MEVEEYKFEQSLFIGNPAMYSEYIKNKKEQKESGNAGVTWAAPTSVEEARELMDIFNDIDAQIKSAEANPVSDDDAVKPMNFIQMLGGINLDEIGGDD